MSKKFYSLEGAQMEDTIAQKGSVKFQKTEDIHSKNETFQNARCTTNKDGLVTDTGEEESKERKTDKQGTQAVSPLGVVS